MVFGVGKEERTFTWGGWCGECRGDGGSLGKGSGNRVRFTRGDKKCFSVWVTTSHRLLVVGCDVRLK